MPNLDIEVFKKRLKKKKVNEELKLLKVKEFIIKKKAKIKESKKVQKEKEKIKAKKEQLKQKTQEILEEEIDIPTDESASVDYSNIGKNKSKKKKGLKHFNEYSKVTNLVKIYKETQNEKDLLPILENLSGLVNSFTIILAPSHATQQIFFNPYMKKFLYLFMTDSEKVNTTYDIYMQVVYRLRWTMRHYSYEDIYNMVLSILIEVINKMTVIEGCDCIYYIQFIAKFQMQNIILKHSKDAISCIIDLPSSSNETVEEESNEEVDRLQYNYAVLCKDEEDRLIESITENIDISILLRDDQEYGCFTYYEKYILYMIEYLGYSDKEILQILKVETGSELEERIEDIYFKKKLLQEG